MRAEAKSQVYSQSNDNYKLQELFLPSIAVVLSLSVAAVSRGKWCVYGPPNRPEFATRELPVEASVKVYPMRMKMKNR